MKKANLIFSFLIMLLGFVIIGISLGYPRAESYGTGVPGPGLWPIVIAIVMIFCSVVLLIRTFRFHKDEEKTVEFNNSNTKRVYISMGILILYTLALEPLGFIISTFILEAVFIQWFSRKNPLVTALIALGTTLGIYFIFKYALNVPIDSFGIFSI